MPIYKYECRHCFHIFEKIEPVRELSWKDSRIIRVKCPQCGSMLANSLPVGFKLGSKILDTTGRSGYLTDDLTMGKLIDEGGIPYEERSRLRRRDEMINRQKEYSKELKFREDKFSFSSSEE